MARQISRHRHRSNGLKLAAGALAAVAFLAGPALSVETEVKNDSFIGGTTPVVGDFIAGEEAGVWLTSPCDGNIIAVQVAWVEGVPGHGQSLEENIWIRSGASFPTPGAPLEQLAGPVMTPGAINEFRYLDENQTIPIIVPVVTGQVFQVALEFANPTDVGLPNGGPSVIRDIDGCQAGRNAIFAIPGGWINWCLFPTTPTKGDFVIRAVVDCPDPEGACCDADANCVENVQAGDCQDPGDTFFEGMGCNPDPCPVPAGACCNGIGGCLNNQTKDFCENSLGWIYAGNATICEDDVCDLGACCMGDGTCQDLVEVACLAAGGTFQGTTISCGGAFVCPQPEGACCLGELCITDQTEENCNSVSGDWQGPFSTCGPPNPCAVLCDPGDCDCDADVDLNDFLGFAGCFSVPVTPECECSDMDGDMDVDLNDFLSFAGVFGL